MEDIEDYVGEARGANEASQVVLPKNAAMKASQHADDVDEAKTVPGTQSIYMKTYGCSHNISDGEYMEGILSDYGYRIESDPALADLWLINSCTVKDPSQAAFMHLVNKGKAENKHVVVAGCVPQGDKSIPGLSDVSQVGITQIDRVVEVVESTLAGEKVQLLKKKELPSLDLPKKRKNRLVEIIPLSTGCLGSCTYCKTKHARGVLGSYSPDAIVDRVKSVVAEPLSERISEIWLTSEDTGAYGRDIGTDIGQLLRRVVAELPDADVEDGKGGVMLRVGMTNPPYILEHLEAMAEVLSHPRVFAFLHVPVQAGSNRVLDAMRREYTVEEYRRVCDFLLERIPGMTIATDIIAGFPTETESDFDKTMTLVGDYKLAITNISQFYPRPGTPAAKMKRINTQVVKNRTRRLTKLFESFTPYEQLEGQRQRVWFCTEESTQPDGSKCSVGHNKNYVKVLVPHDPTLPGRTRMVHIKKTSRFHVEAVIDTDQTQEQGGGAAAAVGASVASPVYIGVGLAMAAMAVAAAVVFMRKR
jgi:threonylcarbamoyladenosine tRNA methylthiotransferase CDKAL1